MAKNSGLDASFWLVAILTFLLFAAALFTKGFTHDLLLEAGVFLVSVKLILMAYRNHQALQRIEERLEDLSSRQPRGDR
ncbi:MAG: hypothetical protein N3A66_05385 [Planctomycetota bacterium]|nr:hypothetical protein [Planctomycetota bacterium]